VAKQRIRCTVCGAKNDVVDHCRICATLLPGADKRRREGTGGRAFSESVEKERAAWDDYKNGRMSAAARSRRPASLPDAPPSTWGAAARTMLDDDGEALPPHAQFGPPPGGTVIERKPARHGPTVRGTISVLVALVVALAIGYAAWYLLVRDDDPAPVAPATTVVSAPHAVAPSGGITVTFGS
jgi:hypothetical protein